MLQEKSMFNVCDCNDMEKERTASISKYQKPDATSNITYQKAATDL